MSEYNSLVQRINSYLYDSYRINDIDYIPTIDNITLGNQVYRSRLCTLCIDMRDSSDLIKVQGNQVSGQIHKAFLTIVTHIIRQNGGRIRSFQGDSVLAFWKTDRNQLNLAMKSSMLMKKYLTEDFFDNFNEFGKLDFGIGLDLGEVYVLRVGDTYSADNNDLIFIGKSVNFAVAIANYAKGHIILGFHLNYIMKLIEPGNLIIIIYLYGMMVEFFGIEQSIP